LRGSDTSLWSSGWVCRPLSCVAGRGRWPDEVKRGAYDRGAEESQEEEGELRQGRRRWRTLSGLEERDHDAIKARRERDRGLMMIRRTL
jgi:hypothetical protein